MLGALLLLLCPLVLGCHAIASAKVSLSLLFIPDHERSENYANSAGYDYFRRYKPLFNLGTAEGFPLGAVDGFSLGVTYGWVTWVGYLGESMDYRSVYS